jgi:hypothetical protein
LCHSVHNFVHVGGYEVLSKSSRTAAKNIGLSYHLVEVVSLKVLSLGGYTAIPAILPLLETTLP